MEIGDLVLYLVRFLLVTSDLLGYWVMGGGGVVEALKSLRTSVTTILKDLSPME